MKMRTTIQQLRHPSLATRWLAQMPMLIALLLLAPSHAQAANTVILKANNAGNLNQTASWVGSTVPNAATAIAEWTNTVTSANTTILGGPLTFGGILIGTPGGLVTINNDGNTLTLDTAATYSINLLNATAGLTLNCNLALGAANQWAVATGQTLTIGGSVNAGVYTNLTIPTQNLGTVSLNNPGGVFNNPLMVITHQAGTLNVAQSDTINTFNTALNSIVTGPGTLTNIALIHPNIAINDTCTIGCNLAGPAELNKTGQGTAVLSGTNTYTGGTWISGANSKLTISSPGTLGPGWVLLSTSGNVLNLGGTTQTVGAVTNSVGTIQNGTLIGTSFTCQSGAISAALAGTGVPLVQNSAGATTTLSGVNTYSGNTTIAAGTLVLSGSGSIANSPVISVTSGATFNVSAVSVGFALASGQTLTGAGSVVGAVRVPSGAILTPGTTSGGGTLTVSDLTLSSGSILQFEFPISGGPGYANVTDADSGGGLTINGGSVYLYQAGTTSPFTQAGTYTLFQYAGSPIGGTGISALSVANPQAGYTYTFADTGNGGSSGAVTVTIGSPSVVYWNLNSGGSWTNAADWTPVFVPNAVGEAPNFGGGGTPITSPSSVTLDGNKTVGSLSFNSLVSFELDPGTPSTSGLTLNNTPNPAVITTVVGSHTVTVPLGLNSLGAGVSVQDASAALALNGAISGAGALSLSGSGTLTLGAANSYNGTTVGGGTLQISGNGTLGLTAGALSANGGILDLGGSTQTVGPVSITGGTLQNGTLTGTSFVSQGNAVQGQFATVSANLAGSGGVTNQPGSVLVLSGNNIYTGNTVVKGGVLSVSADANFGAVPALPTPGNIVVLTGGMISNTASYTLSTNRGLIVGPASGSGSAQVDVYTGQQLIIPGIIANNGGGSGGLAVNPFDTGELVLSGTNTYTGGTTLTAGILTLQGDQSAASGGFTIGDNTVAQAIWNINPGAIVAVASTKAIQIGRNTTTGSGATVNVYGSVTNNGTLTVGRPGIMNLYSGATWLQGNNVVVQGEGNIAANVNLNAGSTFIYTGASPVEVQPGNGAYSGTTKISLLGGTFITGIGFQAATTATGGGYGEVAFNGGTLQLSASVPNLFFGLNGGVRCALNGGVNTVNTIDTGGFNATNYVGITGDGSLLKLGGGTLVLAGANAYTGNTTVGGGTLAIQQPTLNSGSTITISNGSVLELDFAGAATNTVTSLVVNGVNLAPGVYGNGVGLTNLTGIGSLLVVGNPDTDAFLTGMVLTPAGNLSPTYNPNDTIYSAINQPGDAPTVTVTNSNPAATDELFTNGIDAGPLTSGVPSSALILGGVGSTNVLQVLVTAVDSVTTNLYTVNVTVASPTASNPTNIIYHASNGSLTLSWPADHLGWFVQSNSLNLAVPADWYDISNTATGTNYSIGISPAQKNVFYRLRHP